MDLWGLSNEQVERRIFYSLIGVGGEDLELLRKTKAKPNEMAPAWSLVGLAYARLGHGTLAVEALRQAATLDPHREEGWLNLTRELMELGRYAEAISAAEKGIAANPNSYVLQLRLGAASLAAGQYHDAERVFRSLADAGDPLPTSYIGLAQVLLREGRAEDAVSEQRRVGYLPVQEQHVTPVLIPDPRRKTRSACGAVRHRTLAIGWRRHPSASIPTDRRYKERRKVRRDIC